MTTFDTKINRYPFVPIPRRPVYDWPNGTRLAVYFALNIEAFEFGRNPGPDFTTMPSAPFHRGYAYRDFGNRVGAWRTHGHVQGTGHAAVGADQHRGLRCLSGVAGSFP